jgi:hypothetical protein
MGQGGFRGGGSWDRLLPGRGDLWAGSLVPNSMQFCAKRIGAERGLRMRGKLFACLAGLLIVGVNPVSSGEIPLSETDKVATITQNTQIGEDKTTPNGILSAQGVTPEAVKYKENRCEPAQQACLRQNGGDQLAMANCRFEYHNCLCSCAALPPGCRPQ